MFERREHIGEIAAAGPAAASSLSTVSSCPARSRPAIEATPLAVAAVERENRIAGA